jgi:hypothetical protein
MNASYKGDEIGITYPNGIDAKDVQHDGWPKRIDARDGVFSIPAACGGRRLSGLKGGSAN